MRAATQARQSNKQRGTGSPRPSRSRPDSNCERSRSRRRAMRIAAGAEASYLLSVRA